jgi:hypothetical protein
MAANESYRVYFDTSGRPEDHPGVVVAGCVSSSDQWDRLEPDWNRILLEEGVKEIDGYRALHMKDLGSSKRAFEGWTPEQKARLLSRLGLLLQVRAQFLVGRGVPISVHDASQAVLIPGRTGWAPHPLTWCASACVEEVGGWCERANLRDSATLIFVFEQGDPNKGEIERLMTDLMDTPWKRKAYHYGGWEFGTKRVVGLQAADWIAYETFLWGKREVLPQYGEEARSKYPRRVSIEVLGEIPNSIAYVADLEEFLKMFRDRFNAVGGPALVAQIIERNRENARQAEAKLGRHDMRSVRADDVHLDRTAGDPTAIQRVAAEVKKGTPEETLKAIQDRLAVSLHTNAREDWNSPNRGHWTSSQMLARGVAWGCSAYAQVACHVARACGIPGILVKALNRKWIEKENMGDGRANGHVYVEVLINGRPCLWDAQGGRLHTNYNPQSDSIEDKRIYDKGGPDEIILSHHGPEWEEETKRRFPAPSQA